MGSVRDLAGGWLLLVDAMFWLGVLRIALFALAFYFGNLPLWFFLVFWLGADCGVWLVKKRDELRERERKAELEYNAKMSEMRELVRRMGGQP